MFRLLYRLRSSGSWRIATEIAEWDSKEGRKMIRGWQAIGRRSSVTHVTFLITGLFSISIYYSTLTIFSNTTSGTWSLRISTCSSGQPSSRYLPEDSLAVSPHLALQLQHPVQQGFSSRRAAGHVNVDWNNSCTERKIAIKKTFPIPINGTILMDSLSHPRTTEYE